MQTFIKAAEVWLPSHDHTLLEFGGGLYGKVPHFGVMSRSMCFGRDEGLPGHAWDVGHPVLMAPLAGLHFMRSAAAKEAGLTCAIAVPTYVGDELSAVLVCFCGDDPSQAGAVELWRNDPRVTSDMTLDDGYYGADSEELKSLSRDTFLPRGAGLPGMAWQRGESVFIDDIARSSRFLRAESATAAGINRGLAVPCSARGQAHHVLTFLSSAESPIAVRVESWVPDANMQGLHRAYGHCEVAGKLAAQLDSLPLSEAGAIGQAYSESRPVVRESLSEEPAAVAASAREAGLRSLLVLPVLCDGVVSEVLALYF